MRNAGDVTADEVPQVYLGAPATPPDGVAFAEKALAGYDRVTLKAGRAKAISIHVRPRQLQYWSTTHGWTRVTGERPLSVNSSEHAGRLRTTITVAAR